MDPDAAKKALEEAKTLVAELEAYDGTIEQHYALLRRTDKMREAMERPYDVATRWMETMSCAAAMNFVIRTGIIDKLPRGGEGVTVSQLASSCRVDALTLRRALRVMAADGIFQETAGVDEYADTTLSTAFRSEGLAGFITMCVDLVGAWFALPKYCETHEPEDLADIRKSPFAFAAGLEGKTYYEVLDQNPVQRGLWNKGMQSTEKHFPIVGMFPFQDLSARVAESPERPYIVDVGGGRGQALLAIREHYGGDFGGELVLQDLPIVIDALRPEEIPGIKPMTYDIFTPQPVKGAHVYFMRRLLHDFHDPEAVVILRNTVSAMAPDSRLIICDMLVPDRVDVGGPKTLYWLDFCLVNIGGKERSLDNFHEILAAAGLELVKVYPSHKDHTVMLETRLLIV